MPVSNAVSPKGGYNRVAIENWSPQTPATALTFWTDATATTGFLAIHPTDLSVQTNKVSEYTAASGVTIDSLLVKDGYWRLSNNVTAKARNAANNADIDLFKLNASDAFEFAPSSIVFTNTTLSILSNSSDGADNKTLTLTSSGAASSGRGALIRLDGNEAGNTGRAEISCGDVGGASILLRTFGSQIIEFYTNGIGRWNVSTGGDLLPAADNTYHLGSSSFQIGTLFARKIRGATTDITITTGATDRWLFEASAGTFQPSANEATDFGTSSKFIRSGYIGKVVQKSVGAISAAGSVQGDSTDLTGVINDVTTVGAGQGVMLPVTEAGGFALVSNSQGTNSLKVYPRSGETIDALSTNVAVTLTTQVASVFFKTGANTWRQNR